MREPQFIEAQFIAARFTTNGEYIPERYVPARYIPGEGEESSTPSNISTLPTLSTILRRALALATSALLLYLLHPLPILLTLLTLITTYHLAFSGNMKWYTLAFLVTNALAAAVRMEESWLWFCLVVVWFFGWMVMDGRQKRIMYRVLVLGFVVWGSSFVRWGAEGEGEEL